MSYAFFCPTCGAHTVERDRRPGGDDRCENGHVYPSFEALTQEDVTDNKGVRWQRHPTLGLHSPQRATLTEKKG